MTEDRRFLIDTALSFAREKQNTTTGLVHLDNGAVPFLDNWLFAYALLSSRQVDLCGEGRALVQRLLGFQAPSGHFPVSMHDYPNCFDRYFSLFLLPVMLRMCAQCSAALGKELTDTLKKTSAVLANHFLLDEPAAYPLRLTALSAAVASARIVGDASMESKALLSLNAMSEQEDECWLIPSKLSQLFDALSLAYSDLGSSPWQEPLCRAAGLWDSSLQTFAGPGIYDYYTGGEPELTPFDCMMAVQHGLWSERLKKPSRAHLEAVGYVKWKGLAPRPAAAGTLLGRPWIAKKQANTLIAAISQPAGLTPSWKGKIPFRCIWGKSDHLHSLIAQPPPWVEFDFSEEEGELSLLFTMEDEADTEEKSREVIFFVDNSSETQIKVGGARASTFTLDDELELSSQDFTCTLTFSVVKGEGRFLGHLIPGSRFADRQEMTGGDKQIFLRTLNRSAPCTVKVAVKLK